MAPVPSSPVDRRPAVERRRMKTVARGRGADCGRETHL